MELAPALIAAVTRARTAPPGFTFAVATDADGTLWEGDVGNALFLEVAAREDFRGDGLAALREAARAYLPAGDAGAPSALAHALHARFREGAIDLATMCELEARAVGDRPRAELDALLDAVGARLAPRVRPAVRALIAAVRAQGGRVHVVTASLGLVVEATLRRAELPVDAVAGAALAERGAHVTTALARPVPLYEGKVAALAELGGWPFALGLGDGAWDATFLRAVHVPVLVHPQPALRAAMAGVPGVVLLED